MDVMAIRVRRRTMEIKRKKSIIDKVTLVGIRAIAQAVIDERPQFSGIRLMSRGEDDKLHHAMRMGLLRAAGRDGGRHSSRCVNGHAEGRLETRANHSA